MQINNRFQESPLSWCESLHLMLRSHSCDAAMTSEHEMKDNSEDIPGLCQIRLECP